MTYFENKPEEHLKEDASNENTEPVKEQKEQKEHFKTEVEKETPVYKEQVHKEHHNHQVEQSKPSSKRKGKLNLWKVSTLLLIVAMIIYILVGGTNVKGADDGENVLLSKEEAASKALNYINNNLLQGQAVATLNTIEDDGDLYNVKLSLSGQNIDSYVTKDGKMLFPQGFDMNEEVSSPSVQNQPATPEVVKSDKPTVELFVMSHCPYGTQMEKGILPVAKLLKDKIDFEVKFVYYVMHGEIEVKEQLNQYCIETEQNGKYLDYLQCFLGKGDGEGCLTEVGIDLKKLESCKEETDLEFEVTKNLEDQSLWMSGKFPAFNIHKEDNQKYGIGGSPTLVLNGETVSTSRDSVSILNAICASFNEKPAECDTQLEGDSPSPGFGWSTSGSANIASCGG
ncbi:MAG: hypothetical protein ABIG52_03285 [Nanoarchaeota archaeon]